MFFDSGSILPLVWYSSAFRWYIIGEWWYNPSFLWYITSKSRYNAIFWWYNASKKWYSIIFWWYIALENRYIAVFSRCRTLEAWYSASGNRNFPSSLQHLPLSSIRTADGAFPIVAFKQVLIKKREFSIEYQLKVMFQQIKYFFKKVYDEFNC